MKYVTREEYQKYVEEMTGGPNGCQVERGGVCHRPDIRTVAGFCDDCEFVEFCLVKGKKVRYKKG